MSRPLTFGSVCSGIEAASVAWLPLGWQCAFVAEIEPFPCAVLKHHYPDVPNHGDMTVEMEVNQRIVDTGFNPNGKKASKERLDECRQRVQAIKEQIA